MSEAKHTPGPWSASRSGNGMGCVSLGKFRLAHRWDGMADQDEMDANARLIAAAPDLLAALKLFVRAEEMARDGNPPHDADDLILIGKAAIAKAEGRS